MRLHRMTGSGNCYRVSLALAQLGIPCETVQPGLRTGAMRTPAFLAPDPHGRAPLVDLDGGATLAGSNAILCSLAAGTDRPVEDRLPRPRPLPWRFFEEYRHEPSLAITRDRIRSLDAVDRYSLADIARFASTHVAHEGGFELAPCAALRARLDRVRATPGLAPMEG